MTARECALKVLFEVDKNGAYSNVALKHQLSAEELSPLESAFATELVYGIIKNKTRLDYIISILSTQKLKKLSVWILNILRMGIYQLEFLDKVPPSAAVNESVKLAKRYGHGASAGFVNGVLRGYSRLEEVKYPGGRDYYNVFYSHPEFITNMLFEQYGGETAKKIISANNSIPPVTVRVNTLKASPDKLKQLLEGQGVQVKDSVVGDVFEICGFGDISRLDAFKDGLFTVQDISACKVAPNLEPKENQLIIDLCAAPGGKSTHIAQLANDKCEIIAFDIHPHKTEIIEKNAARLGIKSIKAITADATVVKDDFAGRADAVLADVPCSGLGIIRRKPDIKWTKTPEDIAELIKLQKKILLAASCYVRPGGILVYSTCTVNKNENAGVTEAFAKNNPFRIINQQTILPGTDNGDGFYICKMEKE